jgi:hypothetical protein
MDRYNYEDLEESYKMVEGIMSEEAYSYHKGDFNGIYLIGFS